MAHYSHGRSMSSSGRAIGFDLEHGRPLRSSQRIHRGEVPGACLGDRGTLIGIRFAEWRTYYTKYRPNLAWRRYKEGPVSWPPVHLSVAFVYKACRNVGEALALDTLVSISDGCPGRKRYRLAYVACGNPWWTMFESGRIGTNRKWLGSRKPHGYFWVSFPSTQVQQL